MNTIEKLSITEKIVLFCYKHYKSSHVGIRDYRKHEATQVIESVEYDLAKLKLIKKGYISKRNYVTQLGKQYELPFSFVELLNIYLHVKSDK